MFDLTEGDFLAIGIDRLGRLTVGTCQHGELKRRGSVSGLRSTLSCVIRLMTILHGVSYWLRLCSRPPASIVVNTQLIQAAAPLKAAASFLPCITTQPPISTPNKKPTVRFLRSVGRLPCKNYLTRSCGSRCRLRNDLRNRPSYVTRTRPSSLTPRSS